MSCWELTWVATLASIWPLFIDFELVQISMRVDEFVRIWPVWIITVGNRPFAEQKQQMTDQLYSGRTLWPVKYIRRFHKTLSLDYYILRKHKPTYLPRDKYLEGQSHTKKTGIFFYYAALSFCCRDRHFEYLIWIYLIIEPSLFRMSRHPFTCRNTCLCLQHVQVM
jgi:hypothetical protein